MDRLIAAIDNRQNPSVVGLDPTPQLVPESVVDSFAEEVADTVGCDEETGAMQLAMAYVAFNRAIIDAVADVVPAVKPQVAMYEALGPAGIDAYTMTCEYARQQGLYVIGDVKRGDIGSTAEAYAHHLSGVPSLSRHSRSDDANDTHANNAARGGVTRADSYDPWYEDAITVNPYLGSDGIMPFIAAATHTDKDIFVLVHTSNPSSTELQELELAQGGRLYERVAALVGSWGEGTAGAHGYTRVGGVFGATYGSDAAKLRTSMPHTMLLVPGYGAQGGTATDVAGMFDEDGRGAIVSSSRGIIGAWRHSSRYDRSISSDTALRLVADAARQAAVDMRDALRCAVYR